MSDTKSSPGLKRREFVEGTIPAVAGAALALSPLFDGTAEAASRAAWKRLTRRISGPVLRPGDVGFAALAQPFNRVTTSIVPEGIARCLNATDVAQAITWAHIYGVPLVPRSGGHFTGGYSVTRGLMIDTKLMNYAQFDSHSRTVTIGGGTLKRGGL
jgi:FAD/FMN-containing dehydrogenase